MKVLIIDDEEDSRSICGMSLEMISGAEVVEAASGSDGLRFAAEHQPDVIILDLIMPEMDGTETLRNLRKNPDTAEIPVIFLTTKGMFAEFDDLKSLGALAVLTKPFDPIKIGDQIRDILNRPKVTSDPELPTEATFGPAEADSNGAAIEADQVACTKDETKDSKSEDESIKDESIMDEDAQESAVKEIESKSQTVDDADIYKAEIEEENTEEPE